MHFSVRFLRLHGRILPTREVVNQQPVVGDMLIDECFDERTHRYLRIARLFITNAGVPVELRPRLFDARLIGMSTERLSLTGFERVDGVEYVQSWLVEPRS
jgi:hypothetical protein